jgi:hypothetical protein
MCAVGKLNSSRDETLTFYHTYSMLSHSSSQHHACEVFAPVSRWSPMDFEHPLYVLVAQGIYFHMHDCINMHKKLKTQAIIPSRCKEKFAGVGTKVSKVRDLYTPPTSIPSSVR